MSPVVPTEAHQAPYANDTTSRTTSHLQPVTRHGPYSHSLPDQPARAQPDAVEKLFRDTARDGMFKNNENWSDMRTGAERQNAELYHFHVYATKHNTHITLTNPKRNPVLSLSAGNLGFRKANRGTFDAAYQLAIYVLGRMQEQGLTSKIRYMEVMLRGFGVGREAVSKILTGIEGRDMRGSMVRVSDSTRLKFGGTRSRKMRRLG